MYLVFKSGRKQNITTCRLVMWYFLISVKVQVKVTLIFILINYLTCLTLLARIFLDGVLLARIFFWKNFPCRNFFLGIVTPLPGISNGPPLSSRLRYSEIVLEAKNYLITTKLLLNFMMANK